MATVEQEMRIDTGSSADIDLVMVIMDSAFGRSFGEAWTRSQLAGILPMGGVSLVLAKTSGTDDPIGFSLSRTVADESELTGVGLLLGSVGDHEDGHAERVLLAPMAVHAGVARRRSHALAVLRRGHALRRPADV